MADKMETFAARLATFDAILPSVNSRTSSSRAIQPIAWPYGSPTPEQLAHAGFFFNPYDTNPDNTTCFLCTRALDGWEEGDNPISEHLKHSPDCGWAIVMDIQQRSSNPTEIQDPTSDAITDARRATFSIGWPHEGKRGWLCQSTKMAEAGWYFCPNDESPDLASCPYCKLSLDGWEETDDPFEEHHRRSSDCSFFVFALPTTKSTKKGSRSKKSRVSKASRLSTQSVMTTTSEAPIIDEDAMDMSTISQSAAKKTKGTKKTTKSRAKKSKKAEPVEVEPIGEAESPDVEVVEAHHAEEKIPSPPKPTRATRGQKRTSEAITQDASGDGVSYTETELIEPSPKRRATAIRSKTAQSQPSTQQTDLDDVVDEEMTSPVVTKKGRKGTKKSASTKARKTSTASTTAKAASNRVRDESILDAAIEADLARNLEDTEPFEFHYKDEERESARFRKQSITASVTTVSGTENGPDTSQMVTIEDHHEHYHEPENDAEIKSVPEVIVEVPAEIKAKKQPKRKPAAKKSKKGKASSQPEPEPEHETQPELMELKPDNFVQDQDLPVEPENVRQYENHSADKEGIVTSPVQRTLDSDEIEPIEPQPVPQQETAKASLKKQGRKGATGKAKRSKRTTKTEDSVMESSSPIAVRDEPPPVSNQLTGKNASKRKSQNLDRDIDESDPHEIPTESDAPETEPEQVKVKVKRGRPSKNLDEHQPEPIPQAKTKTKRGRPSKQTQIQSQEVQQEIEIKLPSSKSAKQTREREQSSDQHGLPQVPEQSQESDQEAVQKSSQTADDRPKRGLSSKVELPPKTAKRYSDLPKDRHRAQSFIESVTNDNHSPSRTEVLGRTGTQERTPSPSPQSSDAENQPPSARLPSARPPVFSPAKAQITRVPLAASTPTLSPSKRQLTTGYLSSSHSWKPSDIEELLGSLGDKENIDFTNALKNGKELLTSPEKRMTVEEWVAFNAKDGEERLKRECERLISVFETEGGRAMRALEGIECIE
ncbi:hypothetical protein BGW36DRAFT_358620 [Talaromyces proteolyticus]|uniref:BIR-domain-containing protein n=1 Tax=Talaromyces proteolyticus TaxID=1131652 RepID=A0AAD4KXR6_9EURO|nr:uncharacterized protein BGW36DRAFT_358620 [Talaromyces proteolyticus]KAH8699112.1 hypothetical protein BGW36DRAFT_358620 [Talaromyces proteolyticus]